MPSSSKEGCNRTAGQPANRERVGWMVLVAFSFSSGHTAHMGVGMDSAIVSQLKKAQGETNDHLDRIIAAQERTNQLLQWLATARPHRLVADRCVREPRSRPGDVDGSIRPVSVRFSGGPAHIGRAVHE